MTSGKDSLHAIRVELHGRHSSTSFCILLLLHWLRSMYVVSQKNIVFVYVFFYLSKYIYCMYLCICLSMYLCIYVCICLFIRLFIFTVLSIYLSMCLLPNLEHKHDEKTPGQNKHVRVETVACVCLPTWYHTCLQGAEDCLRFRLDWFRVDLWLVECWCQALLGS